LKINVTYLPVRLEQLEQSLLQGVGDVIAYGVIVTPEREKEVLFTTPVDSHVKQVLVTGPKSPAITSLEDLAGKEVYVNPLSTYYQSLQLLSQSVQKSGEPPILLKSADPDLTDEDLLEMVNASLLPATVTINIRGEFWAKILPHLTLHPNIVLKEEGQLAWATRKDSPHLRQLLNEFVKGREVGTVFGNIMLKRYLENTHWVKDATSAEGLEKFQAYVRYFQKYGAEYGFDPLMLVAQGYEESGLDQSLRNPSGAVGIMQVIPQYAAAPPISIPNVEIAEGNIHAGAKMMRNIADTYFNDPTLDQLNKILMTFASYNAGPDRVAGLRKRAASEGWECRTYRSKGCSRTNCPVREQYLQILRRLQTHTGRISAYKVSKSDPRLDGKPTIKSRLSTPGFWSFRTGSSFHASQHQPRTALAVAAPTGCNAAQ
jgi:membrane-bound lytic murein transglycosylase MltF